MTEDETREFYAALSRGDFEALSARLADDVVLVFPGSRFGGRFEGRRRVTVFLKQNQRLFQDGLDFTVHWAGVTDGRAIAQWSNRGVTRRGLDYANHGVTVFVVRGGLIAEIHDYLDTERLAETWPA